MTDGGTALELVMTAVVVVPDEVVELIEGGNLFWLLLCQLYVGETRCVVGDVIWVTAVAEHFLVLVVETLDTAAACQEIVGSEMITTNTKRSFILKVVGGEEGAMFLPDMEDLVDIRDLATNSSMTKDTTRVTMTMAMGSATAIMVRDTVMVVVIIRLLPLLGGDVGVLDVVVVAIAEEGEVAAMVIHMKVPMPRLQKVTALSRLRMLLHIRLLTTPLTTPHQLCKHLQVDAVEVFTDIRTAEEGDSLEEEEVALFQDGLTS